MGAVRRICAVLVVAGALSGSPGAHDRLFTLYDWRSGLDAGTVTGVAQDPDGFIWVSTSSGLRRFDGRRFIQVTDRPCMIIWDRSQSGPVYLVDEGVLKRIRGKTLEFLHGPSGATIPHGWTWERTTSDGSLWVASPYETFVIRPDGSLVKPDGVGVTRGARPVGVAGSDEALAWLDGWLSAYAPGGGVRRLCPMTMPSQAIEVPETGAVIAVYNSGRMLRIDADGERELAAGLGRPLELIDRGGTVWAGFDTGVYRVDPAGAVERIGVIGEIPGADQLLVDRENNLWMSSTTSGAGLFLFPAPDTLLFRLGRSSFMRSVVMAGDEPWFGAWWGTFRVANTAKGFVATDALVGGWSIPAVDDTNRVWCLFAGRLEIWKDGRQLESRPLPGQLSLSPTAASGSGGMWMPTESALFHLAHGSDRLVRVLERFPDTTPQLDNYPWYVFETSSGELILSRNERACVTPDARAVEQERPVAWTCSTLAGASRIGPYGELPGFGVLGGSPWTGTFVLRAGKWEPLPPAGSLRPDLACYSIRPGPEGTLWLVLEQDTVRIRSAPDRPEGYEVVERLSARNGKPHGRAMDVSEDGSGGLWLALSDTVMHIPASARSRSIESWPARLVEASVDGRPLATDTEISLPYSRNRLELRFAALTFAEPNTVRYRMRLRDSEPWGQPTPDPEFRFVDLPSGDYDIAVQASTDGVHWQEGEADLAFQVLRPWYLQGWFLALVTAAATGLAYAWHRMRVASMVRLEQQRARIAMDLHDEIGAGLGGIGLMAGLAARAETAPERRTELAERVAAISSGLASSLQDIVWSLRPGATRLESLAAHIVDRGQALFADGTPEFISEIPERLPEVSLSLPVRRDVLLIAQEAMHNARRHSGARRVTVQLEPDGRRWRLTVSDDGDGLPGPEAPIPDERAASSGRRRGLGLASMQSRAREIGARISWVRPDSGGTAVVLVFDPGAEGAPPAGPQDLDHEPGRE